MSYTEYIPRDTVDNVLLELEDRFKNNPFALTAMAMAIDKIDNIPAADVVLAAKAHWIEDRYNQGKPNEYVKCSHCGREIMHWDGEITYNYENYCPECGARMYEEESE